MGLIIPKDRSPNKAGIYPHNKGIRAQREDALCGNIRKRNHFSNGRDPAVRLLGVKLTQKQEFVIGGYTSPEGSRKYFGALLVGYYGPEGLLFAGRVGIGFSERAWTPYMMPSEDQAYCDMLVWFNFPPCNSSCSSSSKGLQERSTFTRLARKKRKLSDFVALKVPSKSEPLPFGPL